MSSSVISYMLGGFSLLAGLSKFGTMVDKIFLSHEFMVGVYDKVIPMWISQIGNGSFTIEPATARYVVGYAEYAAALCFFSFHLRRMGATILLGVMAFAVASHMLLGDPAPAYAVPSIAGLACVSLLMEGDEKAKK
jgi:hypothetical protein